MDYVHNFNGKEFTEDNIVLQFLRCNKSMIMFGDDTWLKLFPNYFLRSDGTTSFFVAVRHLHIGMLLVFAER